MITQDPPQAVKFDVMTHTPSAFTPSNMKQPLNLFLNLEHYCAPVIHPTTVEIITKYSKLANDPETRELRTKAFGKQFGSLAQGENITRAKDTDILFLLTHQYIIEIPTGRVVTYVRLVVDYGPQKEDPNRVRLTPRRRHYTYSRFNNIQNPVEQRTQHGQKKLYVHRYQKRFSLCTNVQV